MTKEEEEKDNSFPFYPAFDFIITRVQ